MNSVIYSKTILNVTECSRLGMGDGEGSVRLYVTNENNGYAVFLYNPESGTDLIKWFNYGTSSDAIEFGVYHAAKLRKQYLNEE